MSGLTELLHWSTRTPCGPQSRLLHPRFFSAAVAELERLPLVRREPTRIWKCNKPGGCSENGTEGIRSPLRSPRCTLGHRLCSTVLPKCHRTICPCAFSIPGPRLFLFHKRWQVPAKCSCTFRSSSGVQRGPRFDPNSAFPCTGIVNLRFII